MSEIILGDGNQNDNKDKKIIMSDGSVANKEDEKAIEEDIKRMEEQNVSGDAAYALSSNLYSFEKSKEDDVIRVVLNSIDEEAHDICVAPFRVSYRDYINLHGKSSLNEVDIASITQQYTARLKMAEVDMLKDFFGFADNRDEDVRNKKFDIRVEFVRDNKFKYILQLVCFLIFNDVKANIKTEPIEMDLEDDTEDDGNNEKD